MAVLVIAIFALREPNGHVGSAAPAPTSGGAKNTSPAKQSTPPRSGSTGGTANNTGSASTPGSGTNTQAAPDSLKSVPLVVLNNTTVAQLAQQAADQFRAGGWTVTSVGNLQNEILSTCAYYDPNDPQAKAAAQALQQQFPVIKRTKAKFPELPAGPVVVVLTPDYTAG